MDNYSKYLHHAQEVYFKDVLLKIFKQAKVKKLKTYWEQQQTLPFHIDADVVINNHKYMGILEYRSYSVKGYNTEYGMFELYLIKENEEQSNMVLYINPETLESSYDLQKEDVTKFYKELAYWAETFKSDRYNSPMDGVTIPDLRDVILTYYQNKNRDKDKNSKIEEIN